MLAWHKSGCMFPNCSHIIPYHSSLKHVKWPQLMHPNCIITEEQWIGDFQLYCKGKPQPKFNLTVKAHGNQLWGKTNKHNSHWNEKCKDGNTITKYSTGFGNGKTRVTLFSSRNFNLMETSARRRSNFSLWLANFFWASSSLAMVAESLGAELR